MAPFEPSDKEDEYFLKMDAEKVKKLRADLDRKREQDAKQQRKQSHWMKCPKCGSDLEEAKYQQIVIDRCTECKGIWLDHGELEILAQGEATFSKRLLNKFFG